MIGAPLQSNIFVTQKSGLLAQCNSASATYLFQQDKFYDVSYDTGVKSNKNFTENTKEIFDSNLAAGISYPHISKIASRMEKGGH